jgi:hypothetical protein
MFDPFELGIEFFEGLTAIDVAIVERAAEEPCRDCGGPLHRGDYPRKPRGGVFAAAAEVFGRRFSLCCGRDGCRHRATPPSVRFLGRRVYVGAVVIVASAVALAAASARAAERATGFAGGGGRSRRAPRSWSSRPGWSLRSREASCPRPSSIGSAARRPCASRNCSIGSRHSRRRACRADHVCCGALHDRSRAPTLAQKMALPLFSRARVGSSP